MDHGFINHSESFIFLPCNHPSRVKLHTSSVRSHDTDTPFWLDTCTTFDPLLTATPLSVRSVVAEALLQLAFTCDTKIFFFFFNLFVIFQIPCKKATVIAFHTHAGNQGHTFNKLNCFSSLLSHLLSPAVTNTCPLCWILMVLLFIPNRRKFCESELSSNVNEGSVLTSWARRSGHEPGSSYRWPSNVTTNWSATSRAWSYGEKQNKTGKKASNCKNDCPLLLLTNLMQVFLTYEGAVHDLPLEAVKFSSGSDGGEGLQGPQEPLF